MLKINKLRKRLFYAVFIMALLLPVFATVFHPSAASASGEIQPSNINASWIDRGHIQVKVTYPFSGVSSTKTYQFADQDIFDGSMHFAMIGAQGCEQGQIAIFDYAGTNGSNLNSSSRPVDLLSTRARIYLKLQSSQGGGCDISTKGSSINASGQCTPPGDLNASPSSSCFQYKNNPVITINSPQNYWIYWNFTSGTQISRIDGNSSWDFTATKVSGTSSTVYAKNNDGNCKDIIIIDGSLAFLYELDSSGPFGTNSSEYKGLFQSHKDILSHWAPNCKLVRTPGKAIDDINSQHIVNGWGTVYQGTAKTPVTGGSGGVTGAKAGDQNPTCEASGNPLTWILCPVFNGVADTADWLFSNLVQPFLYTNPVSINNKDPSFQIWSSFRIYGNILLVVALLVIVFGQAIGGGIIDAYTAKKMLPRILIAAILINLSIYIVNFMVDITNIVGGGLGELMLAPLRASHQLNFTPTPGQSVSVVFYTGFLAIFAGGTAIGGILGGLAFGAGAFIANAAIFIVMAVVIPFVLALVGVFVTLILRQGLLLLLILVSPVAFALYCLPNTEEYFRKWWSLLFKTLLVYPIVIALFAIADILSVTLLNANGMQGGQGLATSIENHTLVSPLAAMVAFVLQFLPLFLIPFAFRFAGGAVTAIHGALTSGSSKVNGLFKGRREYAQRTVQNKMLEGRGDLYNKLQTGASSNKSGLRCRFQRGGARFMRDRIAGYNLEGALSAVRKERGDELNAIIATGDDDEIRALNTDRELVGLSRGGIGALRASHFTESVFDASTRTWSDGDFRDDNGTVKLSNMSGLFYQAAEAQAALQRWGGDRAALQKSYSYEIQKALLQKDSDSVASHTVGLQKSWGMTDEQMAGLMIGAGFEMQGKSKQWKRYKVQGGKLHLDGKGLADEQHSTMGTYQALAQDADTFTTMAEAFLAADREKATNPIAADSVTKIEEFALRFDTLTPGALQAQVNQALAAQAAATNQPYDPTSSASADAAAAIQELIQTVKTRQKVAGGKLAARRRSEVIDFK